MEYTIQQAGSAYGTSQSPSLTKYYPLATDISQLTTEVQAQTKISDTLTASNLFVRVMTNTLTAATTARTRKGAANGNLTLSIAAAATGAFEDTTHSDSLVATNLYNFQAVTVAGGTEIRFAAFAVTLSHADTLTQHPVATGGTGYGATTTYSTLGSTTSFSHTTEAGDQYPVKFTATLSKLRAYVSANNINGTSTLRTRKNTANGAQSVSIGISGTGAFEDTTHTDSLASGDLVNLQFVGGGTGGSATITVVHTRLQSVFLQPVWDAAPLGYNNTKYLPPSGRGIATATESDAQLTSRIAYIRGDLVVKCTQNSVNGTTTVRTRKNTGDGTVVISIGSSATGTFEDAVNSDSIASGDIVDIKGVAGGTSGTIYLGPLSTLKLSIVIPTVTTQAASGLGLD